jgi:hypothetical protein
LFPDFLEKIQLLIMRQLLDIKCQLAHAKTIPRRPLITNPISPPPVPTSGHFRNRDLAGLSARSRPPHRVAKIVRLREELGISADILIGPHRRAA